MDLDSSDLARTPREHAFLERLIGELPHLTIWTHGDDGQEPPWLCATTDFVEEGQVRDTLRLDFDGRQITGGFSPSFLNGDSGVPARAAGVDLSLPDGIEISDDSPAALADAAVDWFRCHIEEWPRSTRRTRWHRPGLPQRPAGDPDGPWYRSR